MPKTAPDWRFSEGRPKSESANHSTQPPKPRQRIEGTQLHGLNPPIKTKPKTHDPSKNHAAQGKHQLQRAHFTQEKPKKTIGQDTDGQYAEYGPEVIAWWAVNKPYYQKFNQSIPSTNGVPIGKEISDWETLYYQPHLLAPQAKGFRGTTRRAAS